MINEFVLNFNRNNSHSTSICNMKKTYLIAFFLIFWHSISYGQDNAETGIADSLLGWKTGGLISINFSQASFSNWAAGGENNIGINGFYKPFLNFRSQNWIWENTLDLRYGKVKTGSVPGKKSDDLIDFDSKIGLQASKKWYYSLLLDFTSQFDEGVNPENNNAVVSKFMAPGYLGFALGMDFKPNDKMSLFLSPATARTTFVLDDNLSNQGAYGVTPGEKSWTQYGPSAVFKFKDEVIENVVIDTKASLLYEYASDASIVFNWDLIIGMKINNFLTATITTGLIYDQNVLFNIFDDAGNVIDTENRWQFKEVLAIGVAFKY